MPQRETGVSGWEGALSAMVASHPGRPALE